MILNGRMTNPGELRTLVTFKSRVMTSDHGFRKPSYTKIADAYVRWKNAHGAEARESAALEAVQTATLLARYRTDVDATCIVEKNGVVWEIISPPDNIEERGEYMEIQVKRVKDG